MSYEEAVRKIREGARAAVLGGRTDDSAIIWVGPQVFRAGCTRERAKQLTSELHEAAKQLETGAQG